MFIYSIIQNHIFINNLFPIHIWFKVPIINYQSCLLLSFNWLLFHSWDDEIQIWSIFGWCNKLSRLLFVSWTCALCCHVFLYQMLFWRWWTYLSIHFWYFNRFWEFHFWCRRFICIKISIWHDGILKLFPTYRTWSQIFTVIENCFSEM